MTRIASSPRYSDKYTMTKMVLAWGDTGDGDPGQQDRGIYATNTTICKINEGDKGKRTTFWTIQRIVV